MTVRMIPAQHLDQIAVKAERLLAVDDPLLLSSLHGKPYKAEAIRYILLTQYPDIITESDTAYSDEDTFYTRFFWHNVARGVIQAVEPDSLLFLGDMDDVLGSPSGFFDKDDLDDLYDQADSYISLWESRNRHQ